MKKLLIGLIMILGATNLVSAQNTGTTPFKDSYHYYQVNGGTQIGTNTYVWKVFQNDKTTEATATQFVFTDLNGDPLGAPGTPATDQAKVYIKWLEANTGVESFYVSITETNDHCSTNRLLKVTVGTNTFDIYAELVGADDACATVSNPVVDNDDAGDGSGLGNNSDDTFGNTSRNYKVKAYDLAINKVTGNTVAWNYIFTLVDKKIGTAVDEGLTDLSITVDGKGVTSGSTINIAEGTIESDIAVSYTTNNNRQDEDLDMVLEITGGSDALGTPDSNGKADSENLVKFIIRAVPATTGITTD